MQEVAGSIPAGSTTSRLGSSGLIRSTAGQTAREVSTTSPSSRGLGHYPFTVATGVRIPVGTPTLQRPASAGLCFFRNIRALLACAGIAGFGRRRSYSRNSGTGRAAKAPASRTAPRALNDRSRAARPESRTGSHDLDRTVRIALRVSALLTAQPDVAIQTSPLVETQPRRRALVRIISPAPCALAGVVAPGGRGPLA